MQLKEDSRGVYVNELEEVYVASEEEMLEYLQKGTQNRHIGSTSMNERSSRSHSVCTIMIERTAESAKGVAKINTSKFHLIDLAGSERQKLTGAYGDRLKESSSINKSLSAIGNVINALVCNAEGKSNRFVPYRDTKLTYLLKDSLGGNSKTSIVANISPAASSYGETLSTLKFAQRAKLVRNRVFKNENLTGTNDQLRAELNELKAILG